jgi:hypothetical protein
MQTFETFGKASGLYVSWPKTKAVHISEDPIPQYLLDMRWTWEDSSSATKLLGYPMANGISTEQLSLLIHKKLDKRPTEARENPHNLEARVVLSNHLISSSAWYYLTLWNGTEAELEVMQRKVVRFIWAGQSEGARHRVDGITLCKAKADGGLGLLHIPKQTRALTSRLILWSTHEGDEDNLLRELLQSYFRQLSRECWGLDDYTWVTVRARKVRMIGSPAFRAMCRGWEKVKMHITPNVPATYEDWIALRPPCAAGQRHRRR